MSEQRSEFRARGQCALEVVYFGYMELSCKLAAGALIQKLVRWVEREQDRLRKELLEFPQVDQEGQLLEDSEEEEEEKEVDEEAGKVTGESQKGKEVARNQ